MIKEIFKKKFNKIVPIYAIPTLIFIVLYNQFIYAGTQFLMKNAQHYNLTLELDKHVPFSSWWITIYLGCYAFWVINYVLIAKCGKEKWYRFLTADLIAKTICGVIFIVLPTTIVRPEILGNSIFDKVTKVIYGLDMPTNLFPSIHCLASWLCYIGIRNVKSVSKAYRVFSCIFALLVCASTQFVKQHYIVDVITGIAIAEIAMYIARKTNIYVWLQKQIEKIPFIKRNSLEEKKEIFEERKAS